MSGLPPKVPVKKGFTESEKKSKKKGLDDEKSMIAIGTLMNQALSYMIDNGMVEMSDELRTLNVMNRKKVVTKIDEEGLDDDVFKEIGKISEDMRSEEGVTKK